MKKIFSKIGAVVAVIAILAGALSTTAMAAVDSLPDNTSERILNIYKYSPTANAGANGDGTVIDTITTGRTPLANVEFEIYKVPAGQPTSTTPANTELTAIKTLTNLVATVKTNNAGLATRSFGTGNANDGKYLIVEKDNSAVTAKADPFYVSIPLTNPSENAWLYTVTVYPKNDIVGGPGVDKDVLSIGNKSATVDVDDAFTWIIRGDVPNDLWHQDALNSDVYAKNYSFTDTISSKLNYEENLIVKLYDKSGNETVLASSCYTTAGTTAAKNTAGGILKVALTPVGMKYIQQTLNADRTNVGKPEIRVYFDTTINNTALLAENIYNDVTINYTNSANHIYEPATVNTKPAAYTGGLYIDKYKTGNESTKLGGAKFKIARDATLAEINNNSIVKETITVNNEAKTVIFLDFYASNPMSGSKVYEVETAGNGQAVISGLAYGNYYLVETQAPDGYNLLSSPITVSIDKFTITPLAAVGVANSAKFTLPVTGGAGTLFFTIGGVLLIGMAGILIVLSKKKTATTAKCSK